LSLDEKYWCQISEKGLVVEKFYSRFCPLWYDQLGFNAALPAAILAIYQYADSRHLLVDKKKLGSDAVDAINEMQSRFGIWEEHLNRLKEVIDFDVNYDVPYEMRADVLAHVRELGKALGWRTVDIDRLSTSTISEIETALQGTSREKEHASMEKVLNIILPRRESFQTDFEWEVCVKLLILQFPANPYQGEFEGDTDLPMATDNPDVVLRNSIRSLVECKRRTEWGDVVKFDKRVSGELHDYQDYAEEVKANSAIFICDVDGFHRDKFVSPFVKRAEKLDKIGLVCWSYLNRAQKDNSLLDPLRKLIANPELVEPMERILCEK
jgi:hypothetical protein